MQGLLALYVSSGGGIWRDGKSRIVVSCAANQQVLGVEREGSNWIVLMNHRGAEERFFAVSSTKMGLLMEVGATSARSMIGLGRIGS
jgi:hypothetical protein